MKISKEKFDRLKARARGAGRRAATGVKGSATSLLTGVVGYYGLKAVADRSATVKEKWWIGPAVMAVGGHFLRKKGKTADFGTALLGAAGYAGGLNYEFSKAAKAGETGALIDPRRDAGALHGPAPYELPDTYATDASPGTSTWAPGYDDGADVSQAMAL